jgi:hypothetical protein
MLSKWLSKRRAVDTPLRWYDAVWLGPAVLGLLFTFAGQALFDRDIATD